MMQALLSWTGRPLIAVTVAVLAAAWNPAQAARAVDQRVDADPKGEVEIELLSGRVVVEGWDEPAVAVTGRIGDDVETLRVERTGDRVEVEVEFDRGGGDMGAWLTVRVPATASLDISAVSADIAISGVTGDVEAEVVSGDIRLTGAASTVELESVSGDLEVAGTTAALELESVSGDIEVRLQEGSIDAETVSGDLEIEVERLTAGDFESVSGDVELTCGPVAGADIEAESHSGNIDLRLTGSTTVQLVVDTHSGTVGGDDVELGGVGQARVELSTFSGDIDITGPRAATE